MGLRVFILTLLMVLELLGGSSVCAEDQSRISPLKTPGGEKWRIGYYQGGEYVDYQKTLAATVEGLAELGWIETPLPAMPNQAESREIWEWLSTEVRSDYIVFVKDAFYSAGWDSDERKRLAQTILDRLNNAKDIDLLIGMGTWAGQDLANNLHHVNTLIMSASDAETAGIIRSSQDSGYDHVHAHVDPQRYERQIKFFHEVVKFKKLGVIYEDSDNGRSYAAVDKIERIAGERGFQIERCLADSDTADALESQRQYLSCFESLIPRVDAMYVTVHGGVNEQSLRKLAQSAIEKSIPTFSQSGYTEVQNGLLLSVSRESFRQTGLFQAAIVAKVLNGASPRSLKQVFEESANLSFNLKTAELIGFYPSAELIASSDMLYHEISGFQAGARH